MKAPILALFLTLGLVIAAPVGADIYKYTDENGKKRWTDDLSQVPEDQRSSAQRIETSEETATDAGKEASPSPPGIEAADTEDADQNTAVSRDELEKEKADLDAKYQQLLEERKQLEQIKTDALSASDRAELNEKISDYNSKTEQYETQLNAFNEKINAYNQKISSTQQTPQSE